MSKLLFNKVASDLRVNIPIIISYRGKEYICFRADTLSEHDFNVVKKYRPKFVISKHKINFFFNTKYQIDPYIEIGDSFSYEKFVDNMINCNIGKLEIDKNIKKIHDNLEFELYSALLELFCYSEILPLGLMVCLDDNTMVLEDICNMLYVETLNDLSKISVADVLYFSGIVYDNIIRRASTEIFLSDSIKTELIVYECDWKQHTVIIFNKSDASQESKDFAIQEGIELDTVTKPNDSISIPVLRVHSSCHTGDIFNSLSCDCHSQLEYAMSFMKNYDGLGILIYLNQEGRGIGLINKLTSYTAQNKNKLDTVDANISIGFKNDCRDFNVVAKILKDINISNVNILTNNIEKIKSLELNGIKVLDRIDCKPVVNTHNLKYLTVKASRLGHLIPSV